MCLACEEEAFYRAYLEHLEKKAKDAQAPKGVGDMGGGDMGGGDKGSGDKGSGDKGAEPLCERAVARAEGERNGSR